MAIYEGNEAEAVKPKNQPSPGLAESLTDYRSLFPVYLTIAIHFYARMLYLDKSLSPWTNAIHDG
jgi:hypothetical protein